MFINVAAAVVGLFNVSASATIRPDDGGGGWVLAHEDFGKAECQDEQQQ